MMSELSTNENTAEGNQVQTSPTMDIPQWTNQDHLSVISGMGMNVNVGMTIGIDETDDHDQHHNSHQQHQHHQHQQQHHHHHDDPNHDLDGEGVDEDEELSVEETIAPPAAPSSSSLADTCNVSTTAAGGVSMHHNRHEHSQSLSQSLSQSQGQAKVRKDFEYRLKELKRYKAKHGDCMVPHKYPANPSLGTWVDTQRRRYRAHLKVISSNHDKPSGSGTMSQTHIQKLAEVGFNFEPRLTREETWTRRVRELEQYRQKHGHCNVREDDTSNPGLGKWVSYVRRQYRLQNTSQKKMTKRSSRRLTDAKVEELVRIGFVFELREVQAQMRMKEGVEFLKRFYEKEGHVVVPKFYVENPTLGLVVEDIRKEYRKVCGASSLSSVATATAAAAATATVKMEGNNYYYNSPVLGNDLVMELFQLGFLSEEGCFPPAAAMLSNAASTTAIKGEEGGGGGGGGGNSHNDDSSRFTNEVAAVVTTASIAQSHDDVDVDVDADVQEEIHNKNQEFIQTVDIPLIQHQLHQEHQQQQQQDQHSQYHTQSTPQPQQQ